MCKIYHKGESLEGGFYEKERLSSSFGYADNGNDGNCVCSDKFSSSLYSSSVGYNASTANKVINSDHAYIRVNGSGNDAYATNYLVTKASDGTQMTAGAFVISNADRTAKSNKYKTAYYKYSGRCVLRINTAQTAANYTVWGEWNPNG